MILLVEDRPVSRQALAELLRNSGYEILEAESAEEALELLPKNPIKLMIVDFALPHMDGLNLISLVREQWPTMPFVLLSGYMSQQTGEAFAAMFGERSRYFTKPVEPSILEGAIQGLLNAA